MQTIRHFSISQLAEMLRLDRATVRNRLAGLTPIAGPKNAKLYDIAEVVDALRGGDPAEVQLAIERETLRLKAAQADVAEQQVALFRGQYEDIDEVAKVVGREYSYVRAKLRALPSSMALPLSRMDNPGECFQALTDGINEVLTELTADAEAELKAEEIMTREKEKSL